MEGRGGEGRFYNLIYVRFKRGEGTEGILIKYMFGSHGEGKDFKTNLPHYP